METGFTPTVQPGATPSSFSSTPMAGASTPMGTPLMEGGQSAAVGVRSKVKLPKNANRIIFVRGLPARASSEDLYDIFGKYGSLRQVRRGCAPNTQGSAFIVYDDVHDAKNAVDHLNGFNVAGRYLTVLYYDPVKEARRREQKDKEEENELIRQRSGFV